MGLEINFIILEAVLGKILLESQRRVIVIFHAKESFLDIFFVVFLGNLGLSIGSSHRLVNFHGAVKQEGALVRIGIQLLICGSLHFSTHLYQSTLYL